MHNIRGSLRILTGIKDSGLVDLLMLICVWVVGGCSESVSVEGVWLIFGWRIVDIGRVDVGYVDSGSAEGGWLRMGGG